MTALDGPAKNIGADDVDYYTYKSVNLGLVASGAVLAAATAYMFERASAASKAAGTASEAVNLDDKAALETCNKIIGAWHHDRTTSLAAAGERMKMDELAEKVKKAEEKAEKAEKQSEKAEKQSEKAEKDVAAAKAELEQVKGQVVQPPAPAPAPKKTTRSP